MARGNRDVDRRVQRLVRRDREGNAINDGKYTRTSNTGVVLAEVLYSLSEEPGDPGVNFVRADGSSFTRPNTEFDSHDWYTGEGPWIVAASSGAPNNGI